MKTITYSSILCLIILFGSGCGSKELEDQTIYSFSNQGYELPDEFNDSKADSKYKIFLKDFKVFFTKYSSGKTDLLLLTDSVYYAFSGDINYVPESPVSNEGYIISAGGKELEGSGEPRINFRITLDDQSISSIMTTEWDWQFDISTNLIQESLDLIEFKDIYNKNINNIFYGGLIDRLYENEIPDYWIDYFGLSTIKERREIARENTLKQEQEQERRNELARNKNAIEQKRINRICDAIKQYDIRNLLAHGASRNDLDIIRRGMSGEIVTLPNNSGYAPKNRIRIGYAFESDKAEDVNGNKYVGPVTRKSNRYFIGANSLHGTYNMLYSINIDEKNLTSNCKF